MGYMRHHTIIVSSWDAEAIELAHKQAKETLTKLVSPIMGPFTNGYASFFVAPDGSKECWETSDTHDLQRAVFTEWLNTQRYEDRSSCFAWVEVQFGDDELETRIVNDNDALIRDRGLKE